MSPLGNSAAWLVASVRGVLVNIAELTEKAMKELSCKQPVCRVLCAVCCMLALLVETATHHVSSVAFYCWWSVVWSQMLS